MGDVELDTVSIETFAQTVEEAAWAFRANIGTLDPHAADIGDPGNDSMLRTLLETTFGAWTSDALVLADTADALAVRVREIAIQFRGLDVTLAAEGR